MSTPTTGHAQAFQKWFLQNEVFMIGLAGQSSADDLPVTADYRKAVTGPGYVLMVSTTTKADIPAVLSVSRPDTGTQRHYEVFLTWRHKNQFGPLEGVDIFPGDHITIGNNNYSPIHFYIPR